MGSGSVPVGLLEMQTPRPRPAPTDAQVVPVCVNSWQAVGILKGDSPWFRGPDGGEDPKPDSNSDANQTVTGSRTGEEEGNQRETNTGVAWYSWSYTVGPKAWACRNSLEPLE